LCAATRKFWANPAIKTCMEALYMDLPSSLGPDAVRRTMESEARVWGPSITKLGIQND
jgi:hypothetical protein